MFLRLKGVISYRIKISFVIMEQSGCELTGHSELTVPMVPVLPEYERRWRWSALSGGEPSRRGTEPAGNRAGGEPSRRGTEQ
jgi:hypothetical protein